MKLRFENRRISGILAVVPPGERFFVDEMAQFNFPPARSLKLKEVMGYDRHRLADANVSSSDLAVYCLERAFAAAYVRPEELDALIVVTQSPDYFLPPTSSVVQGRLGLKQDMFCLDINQGCAGFLIGLFQAFQMLDQAAIGKVALINVDVLSHRVSPKDRNSFPLIGDGAALTIVERGGGEVIHANLKMDGTRREALMIPAGGFRQPSCAATAVLEDGGDGNLRAREHLRMDGSAVFNFVQVEVPPMIDSLLEEAQCGKQEVDQFLFHQPNRFMLHKLAEAMGVALEKMPANLVENYGNSSGVSIPMLIAHNFRGQLLEEKIQACLAGFGVGLTWASMLIRLGPLDFLDLVEYAGNGD